MGKCTRRKPESHSRPADWSSPMKHEFPDSARSMRFKFYSAVHEADGIHRPMPDEHPFSPSEDELRDLIARIDPQTAIVQWACRSLPLPKDAWSDLGCWAFFVE